MTAARRPLADLVVGYVSLLRRPTYAVFLAEQETALQKPVTTDWSSMKINDKFFVETSPGLLYILASKHSHTMIILYPSSIIRSLYANESNLQQYLYTPLFTAATWLFADHHAAFPDGLSA